MTTATIQSIETRLKEMVGRSFMVNSVTFKVANFRIVDDKVMIATDKRFFDIDIANAAKALDAFLPTDDEPVALPAVEVKALGSAGEIKDIIMDNIRQLRANPAYIPQAQAINESVKVLVEVAKTEVQMLDIMHKIKS